MLQKSISPHTNTVTNQKGKTHPYHSHLPTHPLTLSLTHSKLIGIRPSLTSPHTQKESSPWQQCLPHYPQQGSALLEPKLPDAPGWHHSKPESLFPRQPQLGNRNLATSHYTGDWLGEQCSERWIRRSIIVSLGAEGHAGSELCQTLRGWWTHWNNNDSRGLNLA